MKKLHLLKMVFLLCALIVGSNSLWAEDPVTYTMTLSSTTKFTTASSPYTCTYNKITWSATGGAVPGSVSSSSNYDGQQFGTGTSKSSVAITTSGFSGTISQVKVSSQCGASCSKTPKVSVSVGGKAFGSTQNMKIATNTTGSTPGTLTFTDSGSGQIIITLDQNDGNKAMYLHEIVVIYTPIVETKVATPTISLDEGLYYGTKSVTLETTTTDADIYYTTNGSEPSSSSTKYTGAISVSSSQTIRAIGIKEGLDDSDEASAEYTIINSIPSRIPKAYNSNYFVKVTDFNKIEDGDAVLIVNPDGDYAMGSQGDNIRNAVSISSTDGVITDPSTAQKIVVIKTGNRLFFSTDNDSYLYAKSSSNNYIGTGNESTAGANTLAAIDIAADGSATIKFLGNYTRNNLRYNYNSGSPRFTCYASTSSLPVVNLYKEIPTATITLNAACTDGEGMYYGTYSNSSAFVVPNDLVVSEIYVEDGELVVFSYTTGDVVPANTGVMIASDTSGDHTVLLTDETGVSVIEELGEENMLKPSGDAGISAANMTVADTKFYRLTMHNGSVLGFWWGAANGAAFDLAANKAYLAVPNSAMGAREGFVLDFGGATNIANVRNQNADAKCEYYNLAGQRVTQPTKGLYIVNGKKVVIK